ncbi:hypothetical protein VTJ04DRAFT_8796 [Mycothermus thermophilus]|uniref:uncharacterized protein n=1 Tax=Humicola insolens TaxID=85995 RepID=UPI0037436385
MPITLQDPASAIVVTTSLVAFISGFGLGVYSIRGWLFVSPELAAQRRANFTDPVESEESDVDEAECLLDHAPNWANGEEADRRQGLRASAKEGAVDKFSATGAVEGKGGGQEGVGEVKWDENEECKLVLVVRTDLGMSKGKIAAQCSHATLACYKTLLRRAAQAQAAQQAQQARQQMQNASLDSAAAAARILRQWERLGQAKVAVQVKGEDELLALQRKARSLGIAAEVIMDAGRTQIASGSRTVLGVGPAPKRIVDLVTGGLKLL